MLYTQGKIDCKPVDVGYNEKRLDVLNTHLQRLIDDGEIQCATYCVSRKGKVFAHGAVGKKSFRKDDIRLFSRTLSATLLQSQKHLPQSPL